MVGTVELVISAVLMSHLTKWRTIARLDVYNENTPNRLATIY